MIVCILAIIIIVIWLINMSVREEETQNYQAIKMESIRALCSGGHTYGEFIMALGSPSQVKQAGERMFLVNWIRPCGLPISVASFFNKQDEVAINAEIFNITG